MKQGKTLVELAQEITRQRDSRTDYVADTSALSMTQTEESLALEIVNGETSRYGITDHAHRQIGTRLGIPADYYNHMRRKAPELLLDNVNHWFHNSPERRMVRTLDGNVRAVLSDRYRRIDNFDVLETALPVLNDSGELQVASCEVTDTKFYLKVIFPRIEAEVKKGDPVQFGVMISNSEIGVGSLLVQPFVNRLVCTNGMVSAEMSKRRNHVGRVLELEEDEHVQIYGEDTIRADDAAFLLKIRDSVRYFLNQSSIDTQIERLRISAGMEVSGGATKNVEVLAQKTRLLKEEQTSVLEHLLRGGDLSAYGYANAVTRTAQDTEDYDRATELEVIGGQIIGWSARTWKDVEEAEVKQRRTREVMVA